MAKLNATFGLIFFAFTFSGRMLNAQNTPRIIKRNLNSPTQLNDLQLLMKPLTLPGFETAPQIFMEPITPTPAQETTQAPDVAPTPEITTAAEITIAEISPSPEVISEPEDTAAPETTPALESTPSPEIISVPEITPRSKTNPTAAVPEVPSTTIPEEVTEPAPIFGQCDCASFVTLHPTVVHTPLEIQSPIKNVTCKEDYSKIACIHACGSIGYSVNQRGGETFCNAFKHFNNLMTFVHSRVCDSLDWTFTGVGSTPNGICCHDYKVVSCDDEEY